MDPPTNPTSDAQVTSLDSNSIQTITIGVAACLLTIISIFLAYRQLQYLRRGVNPHSANDIECLGRRQGTRGAPWGQSMSDDETWMLMSSELYTLHTSRCVSSARVSPV